MLSVHPLAAVHGAAVARDLVLVVLEVELVVVAELPTAKTQSERGRRRPRPAPAPGPRQPAARGRERDREQPGPRRRGPQEAGGCRQSSHWPCGLALALWAEVTHPCQLTTSFIFTEKNI